MNKKLPLKILSFILALLVFYFLGREFAKNWNQIEHFHFEFNVSLLLMASLFYAASFVFFAIGWRFVLGILNSRLPLFESLLYFFITQPAKYIPGKVWIAVTRMKFCTNHNIPKSVTLLSTVLEAEFEVFAGAYLSLIALVWANFIDRYSLTGIIVLSVAGITVFIPKVFYFFINLYLKILKHDTISKENQANFIKLFFTQLIYIFGMILFGFSQLFFLISFTNISPSNYPLVISIGIFSYIAGILAVFTPSGLGVREGIVVLAFKKLTAPHLALIFSVASRLWMIIVEAVLAFIGLGILYIRNRKMKVPEEPLKTLIQ